MVKTPYYCRDNQSDEEALTIMREHHLPYLPVLDKNLRVVGVVSMKDLMLSKKQEDPPQSGKLSSIARRSRCSHWRNSPLKPNFQSPTRKNLPLAKVAIEAHALGDLKGRDHAPLDLLAGLASGFAGSPILSSGLIEVGNESVALQGRRLKQGQ